MRKGTCGKCQTKNIELCNGLCCDCTKALDQWLGGEPCHGNNGRQAKPKQPSMSFKLGDMISDELAAENELENLRVAGRR